MNSTDDYRATLRVLREYNIAVETIDKIEERLDKQEAVEGYMADLALEVNQYHSPRSNGMMLLTRMLQDGWTVPEGLLYG